MQSSYGIASRQCIIWLRMKVAHISSVAGRSRPTLMLSWMNLSLFILCAPPALAHAGEEKETLVRKGVGPFSCETFRT